MRSACRCLIVATLAVSVLLGGCSTVRLGYDQAEPLLRWWFDRHLDLDATQARWLKDELRQLHLWHRRTQLPEYADFAAVMARQSVEDISSEKVCDNIDSGLAQLDVLLHRSVPLLAGLARQLEPSQLQQLRRRFADEDRAWRDQWLDAHCDQRVRQRVEDWTERAESYYGRLKREQRDFVLHAVQHSSWDPQLSWQRRQARQQQILSSLEKIIRQRQSQSQAELEIQKLIERLLRPDDVRMAAMQRALQQEACANLAGLHQLSSAEQRLRARDKLASYERDFRQLAATR
jgi:hypothetical protein